MMSNPHETCSRSQSATNGVRDPNNQAGPPALPQQPPLAPTITTNIQDNLIQITISSCTVILNISSEVRIPIQMNLHSSTLNVDSLISRSPLEMNIDSSTVNVGSLLSNNLLEMNVNSSTVNIDSVNIDSVTSSLFNPNLNSSKKSNPNVKKNVDPVVSSRLLGMNVNSSPVNVGSVVPSAPPSSSEHVQGGKPELGCHFNNQLPLNKIEETLSMEWITRLSELAERCSPETFYDRVLSDERKTINKVYLHKFPLFPTMKASSNHLYLGCMLRSIYMAVNPGTNQKELLEGFTDKNWLNTMKQRVSVLRLNVRRDLGDMEEVRESLLQGIDQKSITFDVEVDHTRSPIFPINRLRKFVFRPDAAQCRAFGVDQCRDAGRHIHAKIMYTVSAHMSRFGSMVDLQRLCMDIEGDGVTKKEFFGLVEAYPQCFILALAMTEDTSEKFCKMLLALLKFSKEIREAEESWEGYETEKFRFRSPDDPIFADFKRLRDEASSESESDEN